VFGKKMLCRYWGYNDKTRIDATKVKQLYRKAQKEIDASNAQNSGYLLEK